MKYTVFADGGLQALVNQTKANKTVAADNTAALDGLSTDFENMSGQITNVLGEVETCLNELDSTKADVTAVNNALKGKQEKLTFDATPTQGSTNPVTSGGIYSAIQSATGEKEVFIAIPYETTYQEIVDAANVGKVVQAKNEFGMIYPLAIASTDGCVFAMTDGGVVLAMIVNPENEWQNVEVGLVSRETTINGHYLTDNVELTADDLGLAKVASTGAYSDLSGKPTTMKNPNALSFTGAVTGTYDGSSAKTVNIPVAPVSSVNGKTGAVSLSASDVGADASGAANTALTNAKAYTNEKISALINSAPTTLDTLGEIATAMENNADVVEALEDAIGTKANASDLTAHTGNTSNPHGVTKSQVGLGSVVNTGDSATPVSGGTTKFTTGGAYTELNKKVDKTTTVNGHALSGNVTVTKSDVGLGNVENKSSATIRGEITKANVTDALGYTPPAADSNTTYSISKSGSTITLTGSDGSTSTVTDSNSTYSNATLGQGYGTCATAAETAAKVVTLSSYSLTTGGVVSVKFTYAVPANATMNINSKGAKNIYYRGAKITAGIIEAGDIATFIYDGTQYHLLTVDRHRFFSLLVPYGVSIEASESSTTDINSVQYLKVGNYYCSSNAKAKYVSNLPKTGTAFMMAVSSPLSTAIDNETTKTWVYRLRRLQYYTGEEYVQYCYAGDTAGTWTYGAWKKVVLSDEITTLQNTITQLTNRIAALEASIGFVATESDM